LPASCAGRQNQTLHSPKGLIRRSLENLVERLELLFAEYCRRILSDAAPLPPHARTELAIEIVARTFDKDSTGRASDFL